MKIVFKTDKPISRNGIDIVRYKKGNMLDVPEAVAKDWIDAGWAEEVVPEPVRKFEPDETPERPKKAGRPRKTAANKGAE